MVTSDVCLIPAASSHPRDNMTAGRSSGLQAAGNLKNAPTSTFIPYNSTEQNSTATFGFYPLPVG
jgi:hypothetical protein